MTSGSIYARDDGSNLGLIKHLRDGILIDVEQRDRRELGFVLGVDEVAPYLCGALRDAVDRNYRQFGSTATAVHRDPLVLVRASIFGLWSLADLASVQRGIPPEIARLAGQIQEVALSSACDVPVSLGPDYTPASGYDLIIVRCTDGFDPASLDPVRWKVTARRQHRGRADEHPWCAAWRLTWRITLLGMLVIIVNSLWDLGHWSIPSALAIVLLGMFLFELYDARRSR